MSTWNGVSFMDCSPQTPRADYQITTDMLQALGAVVQYLKPSSSSLYGLQNGQG